MGRLLQICGFVSLCLAIFYSVFKWFTQIEFSLESPLCINMSSKADFYSNAFNNLISIHVGLFTALVAITIAVFGIQKWFDHKDYESIKKMMPDEIKNKVAENKGAVIGEVSKNLEGVISSEVEKKSREYLQIIISANIKVFSGSNKRLFCMQMVDYIWNDYAKKRWNDGLLPLLNYQLILQQLFKEIKENAPSISTEDDLKFGILVTEIQKELNDLKAENEPTLSSDIGNFAQLVDEVAEKFSFKVLK